MTDYSAGAKLGVPVVVPVIGSLGLQNTLTQVGFGTPTGIFIDPYQMGKKLVVQGTFIAGTTTGSTASMTIPFGLTNAVQQTAATNTVVGRWWRQTATGSVYKTGAIITQTGQTTVNFSQDYYATAGTGPGNALVGTSVAGTGENVYFEYSMPISTFSDTVAYGAGLATSVKSGLVSHESSGSFTCYLKNIAGADLTSGTAYYHRVGKQVTVQLPALTATSTLTTFTLSTSNGSSVNTWPSDITPITRSSYPILSVTENGAYAAAYSSITTAGVFQFYRTLDGTGFNAASSVKGVGTNTTITYMLS